MIGQRKTPALKGMGQDWNLLGIKSHKIRADSIYAGGMYAEQYKSGRQWIGIQWPPSLAGKNSIDNDVMPLAIWPRWSAQGAIRIAVRNNLVEVEAHSPNRIVTEPVSAAHRDLAVAEDRFADATGQSMHPWSNNGHLQ